MNENEKPNRKDDADRANDQSDDRKDERSSLDRLADLTRKILRVTKTEAEPAAEAKRQRDG